MNLRPVSIFSSMRFTEPQWDRLRRVAPSAQIRQVPAGDPPAIGPDVGDAEIAIVDGNHNFDPALTPNLRWVQLASAGVNLLLGKELWQSDLPICNASGIQVRAMAEWAFATILALRHRLPYLRERQSQHVWLPGDLGGHSLGDLWGDTLGVVGYGSIGREVGRLGKAFGMRLVATMVGADQPEDTDYILPGAGDPDGSLPDLLAEPDYLDALLAESDVVVLSVPSTPATYHLINEERLRLMRPGALLVNLSRGTAIDEGALARALSENWISGAALDVTEVEPLPGDSPLWDQENLILTPHISWLSPGYYERLMDLFAENVRRHLAGEPLVNVVSRPLAF
ncbi:MAG: D-2-hydroxyacid dehydrogenase [Anaerolineae bacterium]|nr:D-2-hydroxyacid dehydrogenase [Anaerolineae bacterium]